jgi:hypothetical protein
MVSQIRRKPQHTYKSPSVDDHSFLILSSPSSKGPSTTTLPSSAESRQQILDLHKRFSRRKYPMSPPLPLFHPYGRLAMSLPPLDPTLFGLPTRAIPDETFQLKSSSRSRRPTAKVREVDEQQLVPTVSTIAAVAAREVKERPTSPRKRRSGTAKRKRKDIDDGDATYPAKRTRIPRGTAGQNVEEDFVDVIPLNGSTLMPETLCDLVENNNTKRRSARSRASTKRRDSSASETNSISPSTNIFATIFGADTSTNDVDVEISQESLVVQIGEKEEKEEGELSEEQMYS